MASASAGEEQVRAALVRGLSWTVYEANAEPLWARVRDMATNLLNSYWRAGELVGGKSEEAFFVRCGRDTMTQHDIDNGRLIVEVGIAPVAPAEFVLVTIEQMVAGRPRRRPFRRQPTRNQPSY